MLKMFQGQHSSSSTSEFWDASWEANELAHVLADVRVVENDPVYTLLVDKLRPDRLFLEGGCGQSQWVKYFHDRHYRTVGIDFAARTIERVLRVAPELDVRVGNILALPFADGEVHSYYSGGVVEHFETGPEPALAEARRVIARDGWFLCSVPDASFLRRRLFSRARTERFDLDPPLVVTEVDATRPEPPPAGVEFFQYAFTPAEFTQKLADAGFTVERTFGYSFLWGLMELPHFRAAYDGAIGLMRSLRDRVRPSPTTEAPRATAPSATIAAANGHNGGVGGLLRRALVKEDRATPVLGPLIDFACEHTASMRMYVARPTL